MFEQKKGKENEEPRVSGEAFAEAARSISDGEWAKFSGFAYVGLGLRPTRLLPNTGSADAIETLNLIQEHHRNVIAISVRNKLHSALSTAD